MASTRAIRERIYAMDHQRGALVPTPRWFQQAEGQQFVTYGTESISVNGQTFERLQVSIDPRPEFILLKDQKLIATFAEPLAPDYHSKSRRTCPLLSLSNTSIGRLARASWLPTASQVFVFGKANYPFAYEYNGASKRYWYANIALEDDWGNLSPTWWLPWTCLDDPTPWILPPREDVQLAALGEMDSPFISELARHMQVPSNLLASPREYMRIARESCADIMNNLPATTYTLTNLYQDDQGDEDQVAAFIFLCGEPDANGQIRYDMRPDIIEMPKQDDGAIGELFLFVVNLSPQQIIAFGAPADDVEGFFAFRGEEADDSSADVFLIRPGVANAVWIVLDLYPTDTISDVIYGSGPIDEEFLYEAETWIEKASAKRGRIKLQ